MVAWNPALGAIGLAPYTTSAGESLAPGSDYNGDGYTNAEEAEAVAASDNPDPIHLAQLATNFIGPFWPVNPVLPVAGGAALGLLASALLGIAGCRVARRERG